MSTRIISSDTILPLEERLRIRSEIDDIIISRIDGFGETLPALGAGISRLTIDTINIQDRLDKVILELSTKVNIDSNDESIINLTSEITRLTTYYYQNKQITDTLALSFFTLDEKVNLLIAIAANQITKQDEANGYLKIIAEKINSGIVPPPATEVGDATSIGTPNIVNTTQAYTAKAADFIFTDTSTSSLTITLPPSPKIGDMVSVLDTKNTFTTNPVYISSTYNIAGSTSNYIVNNEPIESFIYTGTRYGWAPVSVNQIGSWNYISENHEVTVSENFFVDTYNAPVVLTLPVAPTTGQYFTVIDISGSFDINPCTISPIGKLILGQQSLELDVPFISITFMYNGSEWVMIEDISTPSNISSNYTAKNGDLLLVDTHLNPVSITLPSSPAAGNKITISDSKGTFATKNCTVIANTLIADQQSPLVLDINFIAISFVYTNNQWSLKY